MQAFGRWTVVASIAFPAAIAAQSRHEIVRGRVTSDSARVVRGADVIVTKTSDRSAKTAKTDTAGQFSTDWPDGTGDYAVTVTAVGFQTVSIHVARTGSDSVLVADVRLASGGQRLAPVVTQARRPVPDRDPTTYGAGGVDGATIAQNAARRLPPDQAGDINAIAAMLPGVTPVAGGISVLGLGSGQNSVTMNGLAFSGVDVPRDALTRIRVLTSTYDPSNGWFSGAQTAVDLVLGGQFTGRTSHLTLDAPAMQYSDPISARSGQRYTNLNGSLGGNGPLGDGRWAYNYGLQGGRKSSDVASLVTAEPGLLQHAGVAPDSAAHLLTLLRQEKIPASLGGLPDGTTDDNVSFIGRIDHAPYDWIKLAANPTTYGLQAYGKWSRTQASGFNAVSTPAHSGTSSQLLGALTGFYTTLFGDNYLADVKSGVTLSHNTSAPYLALPDGRALVVSDLPSGGGVSTLQFGGNSAMQTDTRALRWETNAQAQLYPPGALTHRVKLAADARFDAFSQDLPGNRLGTFSYNSLSDLAANRPSSFTRTLTSPTRTGGEWNGFVALGDLWRANERLQVIYGARVDANAFSKTPAYNAAVSQAFGLRTDHGPNSIDVSPRLGFTWQNGSGKILRGGVGEFRNLVDASLLAVPSVSTGLPGTTLRLACVGAAVPFPDWAAYDNDPSTVPQECLSGAPAFVDAAPNVQLIDANFRPQRSWRANFGGQSSIFKNVYSLDAVLSLNRDQPGTFDRNFDPSSRFTLSSEGRPMFVTPSGIVAANGAVSPTSARSNSSFGRVVDVVSDLHSSTRSAVLTLRPYIAERIRPYFGDVVMNYTLARIRGDARGFDGATFGDPTRVESARGDLDARHQIVAQWVFRPLGDGRVITFLYGRLQSGLPYTPMVGSDINGDGLANDRAFIFDPSKVADAGLASEMRSLLGTAAPNAKQCLTSQLGQAAARNSCEAPWTAQLNASVRLSGQQLLHTPRMDVTINLANPLSGLDQLVHGSNNLHGWGGPAVPDRTLYTVRGYDAANSRFVYDVNQRFGSTDPAMTTLRTPFRLTLDVSVDIARSIPEQMLDSWLKAGRAGRAGSKITATDLYRRFARTVPDPYAELLQQADSLLLSGAETAQIQAVDKQYRPRVDALWNALAQYLASLPDRYDFDAAARRTDETTDDVWELTRLDVQQQLGRILAPAQQAMLSGWAGQLFRARDRLHIRLSPRAG
jgi:hypothetical protein